MSFRDLLRRFLIFSRSCSRARFSASSCALACSSSARVSSAVAARGAEGPEEEDEEEEDEEESASGLSLLVVDAEICLVEDFFTLDDVEEDVVVEVEVEVDVEEADEGGFC